MSSPLRSLLLKINCGPPDSVTPIAGGCINHCYHVICADNRQFFFKTHNAPPAGFFQAEAVGLNAIAATKKIRVPKVFAVSEQGLLLEYLTPSNPDQSFWHQLGEQLAALHQSEAPCFGFPLDNFCGLTPQPNNQNDSGIEFFGQQRLMYQARLALTKNRFSELDFYKLEELCQRLDEWIPAQAPTLIHGDLWSGNIYCSNGEPVLIDPATYWGWGEADIAMSRLFGGFSDAFYQSYHHHLKPADGWLQRLDLYNLYHLLNHLNLFGSSYLSQVRKIIRHYVP